MDEIEFMVAETFRHLKDNFNREPVVEKVEERKEVHFDLPTGPGILYHLQKSTSVFVVRTLISENIAQTFRAICDRPEDYPSLRLVDGSDDVEKKLRFFPAELSHAEIINDQLNNRRFPVEEESLCNLSDPGFSWWLTKKADRFQVAFTLSMKDDSDLVKLGPLGDQQLALKNFRLLQDLLGSSGLMTVQNESNRVTFEEGEAFLREELQDLFEFGVMSGGLTDVFKILARQCKDQSKVETLWFYLLELSMIRRFWIQVQYDLES